MLELRPTCENCNKALPPMRRARICSRMHLLRRLREGVLGNVCPNCGGGFAATRAAGEELEGRQLPGKTRRVRELGTGRSTPRARTLRGDPRRSSRQRSTEATGRRQSGAPESPGRRTIERCAPLRTRRPGMPELTVRPLTPITGPTSRRSRSPRRARRVVAVHRPSLHRPRMDPVR